MVVKCFEKQAWYKACMEPNCPSLPISRIEIYLQVIAGQTSQPTYRSMISNFVKSITGLQDFPQQIWTSDIFTWYLQVKYRIGNCVVLLCRFRYKVFQTRKTSHKNNFSRISLNEYSFQLETKLSFIRIPIKVKNDLRVSLCLVHSHSPLAQLGAQV